MRDELVDFLERARVEEQFQPLAGHEFADLVLPAQALLAAAELGAPLAVAQRGKGIDRAHSASTQGLLSAPTPCTLTITRSPGTSGPTPDGVPVVITSPASSVQKRVSHSTM